MQYSNTMIWEILSDTDTHLPDPCADFPKIVVIDESWQRSMCNSIGLNFYSDSKQPSNIAGLLLRDYEPYETDDIVGDGNCLFRCLSKIIMGMISRSIASEGTSKMDGILI